MCLIYVCILYKLLYFIKHKNTFFLEKYIKKFKSISPFPSVFILLYFFLISIRVEKHAILPLLIATNAGNEYFMTSSCLCTQPSLVLSFFPPPQNHISLLFQGKTVFVRSLQFSFCIFLYKDPRKSVKEHELQFRRKKFIGLNLSFVDKRESKTRNVVRFGLAGR